MFEVELVINNKSCLFMEEGLPMFHKWSRKRPTGQTSCNAASGDPVSDKDPQDEPRRILQLYDPIEDHSEAVDLGRAAAKQISHDDASSQESSIESSGMCNATKDTSTLFVRKKVPIAYKGIKDLR